jgi:hypothetical protein
MKLYIFNPATDLALANNSENYMPSAKVKQMERDLETLPLWYADPESTLLTSSVADKEYIDNLRNLFGIDTAITSTPGKLPDNTEICPWGWNPTLRKQLINKGIDTHLLPTQEQIEEYRTLSGRSYDTHILQQIGDNHFEAKIADNIEKCREYATRNPRCIFKAPWSGSGKGLLWCFGKYDDKTEGWLNRVIKEQGYVVATPIYNKILDLAIEYYSNGKGEITFVGYSLFSTNTKGAYSGNILQSTDMHRAEISQHISLDELDDIDSKLRKALSDTYGDKYRGYIGVDMIICGTGKGNRLHPCVEVNMRMNMGVVSAILAERYLADGVRGHFSIDYYPTNEALRESHRRMTEENPLNIKNRRILSGYMPLTPVAPQSNYIAYIKTDP